MIALLSPAKNMDFDPFETDIPSTDLLFPEESAYLMNKMKKLSARQIGKMMHLSADLSNLNFERNQVWNSEYKNTKVKQAMFAFNGEVYRGLSAKDFNASDLEFAGKHLAILSGLHGLLRPFDPIQPYRLEMGVKWNITKTQNNLYKFWGQKISHALNQLLVEHDSNIVLNLASNEYSKAVDRKSLKATVVDVQFLDWKNGEYRAVMTWAKNARGRMAREIIQHKTDRLDDLKTLTFDNYNYNEALSRENSLTFTRD